MCIRTAICEPRRVIYAEYTRRYAVHGKCMYMSNEHTKYVLVRTVRTYNTTRNDTYALIVKLPTYRIRNDDDDGEDDGNSQILKLFSPGPQAEAKYSTRGCVGACVLAWVRLSPPLISLAGRARALKLCMLTTLVLKLGGNGLKFFCGLR